MFHSNVNADVFKNLKSGHSSPQLICFPYLGGYNEFLPLVRALSDDIDVWALNLPGHGAKQGSLLDDINPLLDLCLESLYPILKSDYVFFGHSMGGVVLYFLTKRILQSEKYPIKPSCLILSASSPPHEYKNEHFSSLSDEQLLLLVASYGGISQELMDEKELLQHFLPIFRADFNILESSAHLHRAPLNVPTYFLWGEQDKIVPIESAARWLPYFSKPIQLLPVKDGSHLFIRDKSSIVGQYIMTILDSIRNRM